MWIVLKRLSLGLGLIAAAAAVLLISDRKSRISARAAASAGSATTASASAINRMTRLAVVQHASQPVLTDGVKGMLDALEERGYSNGKNLTISKFNAEGDLPTANSIAKNVSGGDFDMILTVSTLSLQTVANANKAGKAMHVFALCTDPYGAGIGINPTNHLDHPKHLAGYATMQPVAESLKLARRMRPELKKVGVIWNPAEGNSQAQLKIARKVCQEMGIELLEATVETSSGVFEAVSAVISRGVEAIWGGGDVTVMTAIDSVLSAARKAGIPVFTVIPPQSLKGALFDLGANYYQVGHLAGDLAADVLNGKDPATVSIDNVVPELLIVNKLAVRGLREKWEIPADILAKADVVIDETGRHTNSTVKATAKAPSPSPAPAASNAPLARKQKIYLIGYVQVLDVEEAEQGIREGLVKTGLVEGRDYEIQRRNAQGDMPTLTGLIDAAVTDQADLIITLSTPTLQAAMRRAGKVPVVFTYCASAIAAGAGKSDTDHLPNITGVVTAGAYDDLAKVVLEVLPKARRLGTLFAPSEVNMVYHKDRVAEAVGKIGMELIGMPAETSVEVGDAATALCHKDIDAICQIPGNLTAVAFPSIAKAAQTARIPLFASQLTQAHAGAAVVVAREHHDAGVEAAKIAARVLRGEKPASIPFQNFAGTKIILNRTAIRQFGLTIPPALEKRAALIIGN
ncbi:MAG TPA: ABC transporter substrate-binding protein [Verrucomicrobiae bacterium]|nr:ABC transporter substrate-binding protein [Verrucomicrobiae bacterium]